MESFNEPIAIDKITREIIEFWKGEEFDNVVRFPGAQPVSIELNDIPIIQSAEYLCCIKYDGERYFLVLRQYHKKNYTILVNRNMEMFSIPGMHFNQYAYKKGCIFDGEMLDGNVFIIHDAVECIGINTKVKSFSDRWKMCNSVLSTQYSPSTGLEIKLKTFIEMKNFASVFELMKTRTNPNDGIIFYPVNEPIGYKTQMNFFKWKPPGHHTIDFLTRENSGRCELITWSGGRENVYETMNINVVKSIEDYKPNCVIEFNTIDSNNKIEFVPVKVRTDKPKGNNLYTVRKTILNVRENIDKTKLIEFFE